MRRLFITCLLLLIPLSAAAELATLRGDFVQGGLVMGQTDPGAAVYFDGRAVRVSAAGRFVFGFGRDFKNSARLEIHLDDGREEVRDLTIAKRTYKVERLTGLPPSKVTPGKKFLARIRQENGEIARIRTIDSEEEWFLSGWQWPALGRVSGVYGSQRILNDIPKRPHFGLDVAA
ncbi:MAG: peptidase, partial [Sneathiella sp.]